MFDIGFFELLLVGIVGLVVIGPERLPDAVRTTVRWWTKIKQTLGNAREELEREVGADDIRRELHNERVLRELRESKDEMERTFKDAERKFAQDLKDVERQAEALKQGVEAAPVPEPDLEADQLRAAQDYLPEQDAGTKRADDYLPEDEESDEDLEDPEYPEHLHDHGDPEFNPHHPSHFRHEEDEAWAEVDRVDPEAAPDSEAPQASPKNKSTRAEDKPQ
ncbi:Sec-independent protein translocase protein TatB [Microbulbifer pacificus]|uniref:Sec-independent protein translocase protein TatB n=1 Tax=Microbulbifer pacificus TaxID=407164 RepID=A0AAU0MVC2_9GAMM|nr:Sec-independent protein translocase protein TatB [Microbulbifer pacificus]WOX04125.1 Sec-independent protein translocase protein TatB [Microbulbifer pacificus]